MTFRRPLDFDMRCFLIPILLTLIVVELSVALGGPPCEPKPGYVIIGKTMGKNGVPQCNYRRRGLGKPAFVHVPNAGTKPNKPPKV